MGDKRRYNRYSLDVMDVMEVNGKIIFASDVKIIDISLGGITLKTDRRLNIGSKYTLRLEAKNKAISLKGIVIRSSLSETENRVNGDNIRVYAVGMQFINMSRKKTEELLNFIACNTEEELHAPCGQRRDNRYHIEPPEKVVLQLLENYRVKKISLGEMLIECINDKEIGSKLRMELSLPGYHPIYSVGRIASRNVIEDGTRNLHAIGVEFINLAGEERKVLTKFIHHCAAIEAGGRKEINKSINDQIPGIPTNL